MNWANGIGITRPLARALHGAGLDSVETAARLGVDPKTVERWLAGRVPYPRNRAALAKLTGWTARDLWPDLPRVPAPEPVAEVRAVYPCRAAVPVDTWRQLLTQAETQISIVADRDPWPVHDPYVPRLLREKARAGVQVRIALRRCADLDRPGASPESVRGTGIHVRSHETVMYNHVYRADDELLVSPAIHAVPASQAPVLHLRRGRDDGMTATYLESFERIWTSAWPAG